MEYNFFVLKIVRVIPLLVILFLIIYGLIKFLLRDKTFKIDCKRIVSICESNCNRSLFVLFVAIIGVLLIVPLIFPQYFLSLNIYENTYENGFDFSDYYLFVLLVVLATALMLKYSYEDVSKLSLFGFGAEFRTKIKEQDQKTKSLIWAGKGEQALADGGGDYALAEYYFRTAHQKEGSISLAFIGLAKVYIKKAKNKRQKMCDDSLPFLNEALKYCDMAMEVERKYCFSHGLKEEDVVSGPIYLLRAVIYEELADIAGGDVKKKHEKESQDNLQKTIKRYIKYCEKNVVYKVIGGDDAYTGGELLGMDLDADTSIYGEIQQKFESLSE